MQAGGMFKFDVFGTEDVRRQFERLDALAQGDALKVTAQRTYEFVQESADKHTKTGELARSVNMRREKDGWFIGHDPGPVYMLFVHWGTRPHPIYPKGASLATQRELWGRDANGKGRFRPMPGGRRLVLRWAVGGKYVFAQRVNHPGYRGDPYFVRAAARIPQLFAAEVEKRLTK